MKLRRKRQNFSEVQSLGEDQVNKTIPSGLTFKEKFKKAGKSVINYAKKNPDEFGVLGASYGIPLLLVAKYAKSGNIKKATLVGSIAAFPIGESYIAAKKGIQLARKKRKELLNGEKK